MSRILQHSLKLGNAMWEFFASATGGFMFVRGFELISGGNDRSDRIPSQRISRTKFKPFAGAGIAIFLLVFISGETFKAVHAFCYESLIAAFAPSSPATLSGLVTLPTVMAEKRIAHVNHDRARQTNALAARGRSESQIGGKVTGPARSASGVFSRAK